VQLSTLHDELWEPLLELLELLELLLEPLLELELLELPEWLSDP
jgi:hypothetical protein